MVLEAQEFKNKIGTFIFVHDQTIVEDYINHNKFKQLSDVKYVFVGNNDTSNIISNPNVIVCNTLPFNIEEYPKLTSYTGWYSIWKNNLYNSFDYINLLEYDVNISNNFDDVVKRNTGVDVIGYQPFNVHDSRFIKDRRWSDVLISSIYKNYNIDVDKFIDLQPYDKECSVTSNHTFSRECFVEYMKWVDPLIDDIKYSELSGHQFERSISLYYLIKNLNYKVIGDILYHFQFDSHKTQGMSPDNFKNNYIKLLT